MQSTSIRLGQNYRDTLTGLIGTATARCEYLSGRTDVQLQPQMVEMGKLPDAVWIDSDRLQDR